MRRSTPLSPSFPVFFSDEKKGPEPRLPFFSSSSFLSVTAWAMRCVWANGESERIWNTAFCLAVLFSFRLFRSIPREGRTGCSRLGCAYGGMRLVCVGRLCSSVVRLRGTCEWDGTRIRGATASICPLAS